MSLAAIVPVWNGRPLVEKLLASLAKQTLRADELVVVDNGSTDGAPEAARACGARVIGMGRNAGFAAAVNRGIRETRAEWIAVLNSDVELAPDYFALLTASSSWFATGRILAADDPSRIDGTFDLVCRGGTAWRAGSGQADGPAWDMRRRIWSAPWTAAVFRAALFEKTGLLEERFESYLEDVDFGLRCAALDLAGEYVPGSRGLASGECRAGPLASGDGAADGAEPGVASGPALFAARPAALRLARDGCAVTLGPGRFPPRSRLCMVSWKVSGPTEFSGGAPR